MSQVDAICYPRRVAVLADGAVCEITNLFDADGEETDDFEEAISAVAPIDDDHWLTIDLTCFDPVTVN